MWQLIDHGAGLLSCLFPRKSWTHAWLTAVSVYASGEGESIRELTKHFHAAAK